MKEIKNFPLCCLVVAFAACKPDYIPTEVDPFQLEDRYEMSQGGVVDYGLTTIGNITGWKHISNFFYPLDCYYKGCVNQGMAVYGNIAVAMTTKGWVRILDLRKEEVIQETVLASFSEDNHANTAQFGNFAYKEDLLPLLYVSECFGKQRCFVERYVGTGFEPWQVISMDKNLSTSCNWYVDSKNGFIYQQDKGTASNDMVIRKFPLPDTSLKEVILKSDEALETWSYHFGYDHTYQGGCCYKGMLLISYGMPYQKRGIHFINLSNGELTDLDLTDDIENEPEDIDIWNGFIIMYSYAPHMFKVMKVQ